MTKIKQVPVMTPSEMSVKRRRSEPIKSKLSSTSHNPNQAILKYYYQRYNLFSKYDEGILMDYEAWYSVTPENIAKHIAERVIQSLGTKGQYLIVDGLCGVGGNLIQFALQSPKVRVIGIDINKERLDMAKNNARVYGVDHQCDFVLGDFCEIMKMLGTRNQIDAVFLSPPWGGMSYLNDEKYSLNSMTPNGYDLITSCQTYLTKNIAFLMPRNVDKQELKKKVLANQPTDTFDLEENRVGNKIKTITAYFGELQDPIATTDSE